MKLRSYFLFALVFSIGFAGCSEDDDGMNNNNNNTGGGPTGINCATSWATDLQSELNAISAAATAYGNNQSTANCNALKDAYQDYVDALRPYTNCTALTGQSRADWEQALQQAEANIANIC